MVNGQPNIHVYHLPFTEPSEIKHTKMNGQDILK